MKKTVKILIFLCLAFSVVSVNASAEEDYIEELSELLGDDRYSDADFLLQSLSMESIFRDVSDKMSLALSNMAPRLIALFGLSVLSALAALYNGRYKDGIVSGVGLVTTLYAYLGVIDIFTEVTGSMEKISTLFSSLIPLFTAVTLSGGGGYTATGQSLGMAVTVSLFSGVITPLFITLLSVMLALGLLFSFGSQGAVRLMQSIKRHTLFLLSYPPVLQMQSDTAPISFDTDYLPKNHM